MDDPLYHVVRFLYAMDVPLCSYCGPAEWCSTPRIVSKWETPKIAQTKELQKWAEQPIIYKKKSFV